MEIETFSALDRARPPPRLSRRAIRGSAGTARRENSTRTFRAAGFPDGPRRPGRSRRTAIARPRSMRPWDVARSGGRCAGDRRWWACLWSCGWPIAGRFIFYDPGEARRRRRAFGTASGTEGNIVGVHGGLPAGEFRHRAGRPGGRSLGPCIRPPHYEVDFAAEIGRQARDGRGEDTYHDGGVCTACRLERYYSYRAEKGKTGRMWARASCWL